MNTLHYHAFMENCKGKSDLDLFIYVLRCFAAPQLRSIFCKAFLSGFPPRERGIGGNKERAAGKRLKNLERSGTMGGTCEAFAPIGKKTAGKEGSGRCNEIGERGGGFQQPVIRSALRIGTFLACSALMARSMSSKRKMSVAQLSSRCTNAYIYSTLTCSPFRHCRI